MRSTAMQRTELSGRPSSIASQLSPASSLKNTWGAKSLDRCPSRVRYTERARWGEGSMSETYSGCSIPGSFSRRSTHSRPPSRLAHTAPSSVPT